MVCSRKRTSPWHHGIVQVHFFKKVKTKLLKYVRIYKQKSCLFYRTKSCHMTWIVLKRNTLYTWTIVITLLSLGCVLLWWSVERETRLITTRVPKEMCIVCRVKWVCWISRDCFQERLLCSPQIVPCLPQERRVFTQRLGVSWLCFCRSLEILLRSVFR